MSAPSTDHTLHTLRAPAKLNLGLEVLGHRPDGYHELVTIFQTIALYDTLTITTAPPGQLTLATHPPLPADGENLALRAARALAARLGVTPAVSLTLEKQIPVAAGLGGGSSDAAATLRALRERWRPALPDAELAALAAALGADVPFFLRGGAALATGIGELLTPLPQLPPTWFVVLTPALALPPDKTRQLYQALTPADFSDGARTRAQAERLRRGEPLDPALLINAFGGPLARVLPQLTGWRLCFLDAGASWALPSGSGPTLYTIVESEAAGQQIAARLSGADAQVFVLPGVAGD
ncbi:MAG: 4-(cytidine 5'-diphospho)-2-C-methyl-D-erythritol kinase [Thermomicrobiales bacterium]